MSTIIEEPIGVLCGKVYVVEKHIPYYLQDGAHSHKYHWEEFEDRNGNKADLKIVQWITKKGKDREAVIVVKWK